MPGSNVCFNVHDVLRYANIPARDSITWGGSAGSKCWTRGNKTSFKFAGVAGNRTWVRMTINHMSAWVTVDAAARIKAAKVPTDDGAKLSFSKPGVPCEVLVNPYTGLMAIGAANACGRLCAPGTDMCGIHNAAEAKRAKNDAARRAKWDAQDAEDKREEEARRRSNEILEEAAVLLEQLGIRPDTVAVSWNGHIEMPSEAFDSLLRRAAEFAEMERMGVL